MSGGSMNYICYRIEEEANMLEDKSISESKLPAEFKWICEKCLEGSGAHTCAWRGIDGELCSELSQLLKNWKQLPRRTIERLCR